MSHEDAIAAIDGSLSIVFNREYDTILAKIEDIEEYIEYTAAMTEQDKIIFEMSDSVGAFNRYFSELLNYDVVGGWETLDDDF